MRVIELDGLVIVDGKAHDLVRRSDGDILIPREGNKGWHVRPGGLLKKVRESILQSTPSGMDVFLTRKRAMKMRAQPEKE
jgi:hypothetical protein